MNGMLGISLARQRVVDLLREADEQRRRRPPRAEHEPRDARAEHELRVVAGAHRLRAAIWLHGRRESA
jgi:hypothetical protein